MLNVPKHCWNLYHRTFIIFNEPCQVNWVGKGVPYWHAISWKCLLTDWLPMTSILSLIQTWINEYLYHIYWQLSSQLSWKKSLLLTCQILGLLVNTLPANEMYPVLNRDNLMIPIQIQLSEKEKTFSQLSVAFLKSRWIFKYFEKKNNPNRFSILEIKDSENVVR